MVWGLRWIGLRELLSVPALLAVVSMMIVGCGRSSGASAPQADAYDRLCKLFNLYKAYIEFNKKPPPTEDALREFGQKLTQQQRADRSIGDELEGIFTSPRDGKKFVVRYNTPLNPAQNRAMIWEEDGKNGMRWVAQSMGYVVENDEKTLAEIKK